MKIRSVRAELFLAAGRPGRQTDRQTDVTKLIVVFRNFAAAPTNDRNKSESNTGCTLSTPLVHEDYSVERLWQSK
jgi:hypothetical protein